MTKKILIVLIICLALSAGIYLWVANKNKKKKEALNASPIAPVVDMAKQVYQNTNVPVRTTATPGINGGYAAVPINNTDTNIIKLVQAAFNLKIDGILGPKTKAAVAQKGVDIASPQKFADVMLSVDKATEQKYFPLKVGSKNNYVKAVQLALGLNADGAFGSKTKVAVQKAISTETVTHKQYTALVAGYIGANITYNGKPLKGDEAIGVLVGSALNAAKNLLFPFMPQ